MSENIQIKGRLLSLNWPDETAGATVSVDLSQLQVARAEIEDAEGVTHRVFPEEVECDGTIPIEADVLGAEG